MFERWKLILSNWNNCYFSHSSKNEPTLDLETLLNIITHLRENLNLDESKSSSFEAHTIKEFIEEKYPEFKFENGTVEPTNEEDIYLVTSLLLFFVCVNSKDVDIKNAMCSKLSSDDQKTILKFSKCLMECSEISYSDVKAAIREACGQDVAAMEVSPRPTVAETPPALRSLHSEVRRLQAALDAERFDRNYLQEELNRTNLRVEKLLKEKAQHKLDIVNLKAKISLCGLETESKDADAASDRSAKLARQLQQIEDKLVETQAQLDDSVYERDVYKKKVEDLKRERDKYLSLSQSEAARVSELSEELDTERRHVQTLKDLITELRQHNRLNILDSSLLECDDPDASILSLPHNSSICSEACANVIEVQLGEERAKTVVLKQQIQSLQDQLNELTTKIESERKTLQNVISDRENNIFNLKHRINEEIEEKNNIKAHYDNEMTKLNNEINELEQRLKDNSEHSRSIIEKKMQEIQTLQEEKLSLLHSLNNETTKLENTIKDLQNDLESEKQNKSSMKENYEAHIMKLNEKVLNRNNELVELQNSVFEKGEVIETLQMELRKEKEAKEELTKQHQELNEQKVLVEQDLQQKKSDVNELQMKLQRNNTIIEDMKSELFDLHTSISELNNKCKMLEDAREILLTDVQNRDIRIEDALKEVEEITNKFSQENEKLKIDLDEKKVTIQSLQIQLKNEIQFKVELQNEMDNLNSSLQQATVLNEKLNTDLTKMKTDIQDKEKTIDAIDLYLQEEKKLNAQANERIEKLTDHVVKKEKEIKSLKEEVARINDSLLMEIQTNKENVEIAKNKLLCEIAEKESLQMQVKSLEEENVQLEKVIAMKCEEILLLRVALDEHLQKVNERDARLNKLEADLILERQNKKKLASEMNSIVKQLKDKVVDLESLNSELEKELKHEMEDKNRALETLQLENEQLYKTIADNKHAITEKTNSIYELAQQVLYKENKLQDLSIQFENYKSQMEATFQQKDNQVTDLLKKLSEAIKTIEHLQKKTEVAVQMSRSISLKLTEEKSLRDALGTEKEQEVKVLLADNESLVVEKTALTQKTLDGKSYKNISEEEKNVLLAEKIQIKQDLAHDLKKSFTLEQEIKKLSQHLADTKVAKELAEEEQENIALENTELKEKLQASIEVESKLCEEINNLTRLKDELQNLNDTKKAEYNAIQKENESLTEQLKKDRITHNYLLQENQRLTYSNEELTRNLEEMQSINEAVTMDRDTVVAEKESHIKSIEIEKSNLEGEMNCLRKEIYDVRKELNKAIIDFEKKAYRNKYLTNLKAWTVKKSDRHTLGDQNDLCISKMNHKEVQLSELQAKYEALQKKTHFRTTEYLFKTNKYKLEIQNLKSKLKRKKKINGNITKELKITKQKIELLTNKYDEIADINKKVTSAINAGLDKLVETLKQSTVKGIDVQTLEDDRNNDPVNNFEVMMKLAVYLVNELVNEFDKLNDLMEQKDAEILNFKAKVTELEEELTKQSENYITSINSKIKDIHTLQEENKSLQNDLNDVKLQLEVKVHSLKEKLVDNENVTDKLKTTYETQIDNLNVMVTKLTNYLKEMTIEVEALKKDKENLLTTIEDSCKVIKSLEEEIKSEKQNIDKIASEFESERLVLKNMVTVTESVMEDQKLTLNNIIADHLKTIEVLTEENDKLKNNIENYVAKFNSVELINDLLRLMLRQEREVKMQVENESEMVREYLDEVISELKNEKQLKTVLGTQKRELMADIEKCKDDLDAMRKAIGELKETNTVLAKEVNTLLDSSNIITEERDALTKKLTNIIADKTELQSTLEEKTKLVTELQTESKDSKYKLNELIKDKDDLVAKEKDLINKIEEMKQINEEVIEMLKIENEQLVKTVEKTTNDLNETQKTLEDLIQTKLTLENVIDTLKEELINSTSDKTGLEYLLSHKTQQLRNIERESKELKDNLNVLITEKIELIEDKNSYIDKLEEINQANISKENENIAKLNYNIEQLVKTVEEKNTVIEKLERIIKTESELNHKLRDDNEREKYTLIKECTKVQEYQNRAEKQLEERETEITSLQKELTALKTSIEKYEQEAETKDDLISEITKEKDEIIISLTQELSDEKIKLNTLQKEITNLKASIEQDNNTKDRLISEITKEKDDIINSLTLELSDEKTKLNTLQQDLTDLKASIEQDNNAKDGLISEINKEKDEIINSLTLELSDVKTKLNTLQEEVTNIKISFQQSEHDKKANDSLITEITKEKDEIILSITQELSEEKAMIDTLQQENKAKQDLLSEITYEKDNIITSLTQKLSEEKTKIDTLQQELTNLKGNIEQDNKTKDNQISEIVKEKDAIIHSLNIELSEEKTKINSLQAELTNLKSSLDQCEQENKVKDCLISEISKEKDAIAKELSEEKSKIDTLQQENKAKDDLMSEISKEKDEITKQLSEKKTKIDTLLQENKAKDCLISEISKEKDAIAKELSEEKSKIDTLQQENKAKDDLMSEISKEKDEITKQLSEKKTKIDTLLQENKAKDCLISEISKEKDAIAKELSEEKSKIDTLQQENKAKDDLMSEISKEKDEITKQLSEKNTKIDTLLQENKAKDCLISETSNQKDAIAKELSEEKIKIDTLQQENKAKDGLISKMSKEKDAIINSLTQELSEEKNAREKSEKEAKMILNELKNNMEVRRALMKENDQLTQAIGQQDTFAELCQEKAGGEKYLCLPERRDFQVSTTSDSHSSIESLKTISDLEKIIHDKNRTITTLQSDITYMKTLMAESENKLLDVSKELEVTKENCQQLSNQLKKIVYQKNEEIAELKKQVNKMSATETRATQIIKVSAKYHAMILKRIAEIKTNTVLKELTNFGNTASDNDLRRSLNAGTITMEELEHFLDTTDRHLKRCAEKQIALQKERDRLYEVNRINESEIINLKKFLNELSLSFQTFSSVKNLYAQKLSRVISVQRTVRREILNQEGRITDAAMCRLERGYAAVMQDLAECAMNLERWVERCISRTVSVEKIKQAFTSDSERSSLSSPSFQNAGLEIQLEELEKSFQKLLEEVANVQGDGARDTQAQTVMEVRAQYEDKLNRMKAKMKELMSEQMAVLKDRQRAEIGLLERELQKTRDKMEESKRGYEAHIRELTKELWNVGEKYLVKTDEAEWLKRKQHSGSLMSLQHVHSSGFGPPQEVPSRPSDAHSLRSLPVANNTNKREGRGLHMSDEEGEVFDNRFLKELTATPRREPPANGKRLSELQFRNSLCPPHLKSSYPAETQFVPVLDEEEIKAGSLCPGAGAGGKAQRKEVGITAYKKPGPPTPSKQAGRLSATDSELRESLRVEGDPHPAAVQADRKTSTPARIRAFLSFKTRDNTDGTPRARRLSYNIFRKK